MSVVVPPIIDATQKGCLKDLLEEEGMGNMQLLYSASEHGWGAPDFHAHCDNKGASVTLSLHHCLWQICLYHTASDTLPLSHLSLTHYLWHICL